MKILVDTSVWVDYFRSGKNSTQLDLYIDQNIICVNNLILKGVETKQHKYLK